MKRDTNKSRPPRINKPAYDEDRPRAPSRSRSEGGYTPRRYDDAPPRRSSGSSGGGYRSGPGRPPLRSGGASSSASFRSAPSNAPARPKYVAARHVLEGLPAAQRAIAELMESFGKNLRGNFDLTELEVCVSFDENGRFIGLGEGGVTYLRLTLSPLDAESILDVADPETETDTEQEEEDDDEIIVD